MPSVCANDVRGSLRSAAINTCRIAEPIAQAIEVMDRHEPQRRTAQCRLPRFPVRDAAHLDGCIDRLAECAGVEQRLGGADRLVITHVLIHRQDDARGFARLHCPQCVGVVHGERLLRENAFHGAAPAGLLNRSPTARWVARRCPAPRSLDHPAARHSWRMRSPGHAARPLVGRARACREAMATGLKPAFR